MENYTRILITLVILNLIHGISCEGEDDSIAGMIAASTIAGVLLCVVVFVAVFFAVWKDSYKRQQLKLGKIKIPRSWLEEERLEKLRKKHRFKEQIKEKIRQKQLLNSKQKVTNDAEVNNMHRSRPQIPGSWRREIRNPNGYIVKEVPVSQRGSLGSKQYMQPVVIDVSDANPAIWQPVQTQSGPRYSQLTNTSTVIPQSSPRSDGDNTSLSSASTFRIEDRLIDQSYGHDEIIEASIDFTNDGTLGEEKEIQERVTAF